MIAYLDMNFLFVQVALMDKVPEDKAKGLQTPIWTEYQVIVDNMEGTQVCLASAFRF